MQFIDDSIHYGLIFLAVWLAVTVLVAIAIAFPVCLTLAPVFIAGSFAAGILINAVAIIWRRLR